MKFRAFKVFRCYTKHYSITRKILMRIKTIKLVTNIGLRILIRFSTKSNFKKKFTKGEIKLLSFKKFFINLLNITP